MFYGHQRIRYSNQLIWFLFILFLIGQVLIETNRIISHDIIWSLEIGKRLYSGGTYVKDFFETNPSLLYFLHGALVKTAELLRLKPVLFFYGFILISTVLCFLTSFWITRHLLIADKTAGNFLLVALVICLGPLVIPDYGQKEQIMMLFSLPYFFLNLSYVLNKPRSRWMEIVFGALAGIGFAFKPPYFFLPLALIEGWRVINTRSIKVLCRWDLAAIACMQIIYLISMILFTPSYLTDILPVILTTYVPERYITLDVLLSKPYMVFFYLSLLAWLLCKQKNQLNSVINYFFLITTGFALSYLWQGKGWTYQGLPLQISTTLFASLVLLSGLRKFKHLRLEKNLLVMFFGFLTSVFIIAPVSQFVKTQMACISNSECSFNKMIHEVSALAPGGHFYMFSTQMQSMYFMYYGQMHLASRFGALWPLPGLLNNNKDEHTKHLIQEYIIEDFLRYKPDLVLVNQRDIANNYIKDIHFNFLTFMTENEDFNKIWQQYSYARQINYGSFYVFDIYLRQPLNAVLT